VVVVTVVAVVCMCVYVRVFIYVCVCVCGCALGYPLLVPCRLQRNNLRGSIPMEGRCISAVFPVPLSNYSEWTTSASFGGSSVDVRVPLAYEADSCDGASVVSLFERFGPAGVMAIYNAVLLEQRCGPGLGCLGMCVSVCLRVCQRAFACV
jgi:hypothetical protein